MRSFLVIAALVVSCLAVQPRARLSSSLADASYYEELASRDWCLGLRIIVKFLDNMSVRAFPSDAASVMKTFWHKFEKHEPRQLFASVNPQKIESLLSRAANFSKRAQPDLMGMFIAAELTKQTLIPARLADAVASLVHAANELSKLESVEWVEIVPLGVPPPVMMELPTAANNPDTPNFELLQTYRGADPGMEATYINSIPARGNGVRLSDCEYSWTFNHEDIFPLVPEPGHDPVGVYADHGTASVGITKGQWNGYGIQGNAPEALVYTYSEYTQQDGINRPRAILAACTESGFGDVVLLEMQTTFPPRSQYSPAETDLSVWTIVQTATDAGVVVVAAAGNGNENLDSAPYQPYMNRGDSGAIIVGAGDATTQHRKASFSTYGSRVNVQAWGDWSVCTGGYGDLYGGSDPARHYSRQYSGTSSASAIVASAVTALQSYMIEHKGGAIDSREMRSLLMRSGVPQGSPTDGNIGPHVNLRRAVAAVP